MEFNKSNRFNDNINQVNQNLIHYKGEIGKFDYDPNIWEISDNRLRFKNKEVVSLPENLELPEGCIDTSFMFSGCKNLTDISPLQNWDTSNIRSMKFMFSGCQNLTDIHQLGNWDISNVIDTSEIFSYCTNLTDIYPLGNWDTSNVKSMEFMFM